VLLIAIVLGLHFSRGLVAGRLTAEAMDMVQAARCTALNGYLPATKSIPPLLTAYVHPNPDGSIPDLGHAPLYPALAAVGLRWAHHTGMGLGDKVTAVLSLLCFAASLGACALLSRVLFGVRGGAPLAVALFALSGSALATSLQPHPALLGALLFTLLLAVLACLEARVVYAAVAGALYGLLYLSLYSALLLLPVLLLYIWHVSRRRLLAVSLFLGAALIIAAPALLRNAALGLSPLFNGHLLDLMAYTARYPGDRLYRSALPPETVWEFLASGGAGQVLHKSAATLTILYSRLPSVLGVLLLPLLLGAALIRFSDERANRLRTLTYVCLLCHLFGIAPFLTPDEALPLFLIYAPSAAVFGVAFLLSVVRSRSLPRFTENLVIGGWCAASCIPGLALLIAPTTNSDPVYGVYYYLNTDSNEMRAVRARKGDALIAADSPWETAFRSAAPSVWLPADAAEFRQVEEQMGRPIVGVVLTPATLRETPNREQPLPWKTAYSRIVGLWTVASDLQAEPRQTLVHQVPLHYPTELSDALSGFHPAPPLAEPDSAGFSLLLWNDAALATRTQPSPSATPG